MDEKLRPHCDVEHWPNGDSSRPHRADPLSTLVLYGDENESTGSPSRLLARAIDQLFNKTAGLTGDQTILAHSPGVKQPASFYIISRVEGEGTKGRRDRLQYDLPPPQRMRTEAWERHS
jgi:hypothetical protein